MDFTYLMKSVNPS